MASIFDQFKALVQLPGATKQAQVAAQQAAALKQRVSPTAPPPDMRTTTIKTVNTPNSIPTSALNMPKPAAPTPVPPPPAPAAPMATPKPPAPTPGGYPAPASSSYSSPQNSQITAINSALGGLSTGLQNLSTGLGNLQTTQTPTPQGDIMSQLKPYLDELSGFYNPTTEEQDVSKNLSNLLASRDLGLVQAEEQPIPLQAILGEQGRIERRASTQAGTLQDQLARLQAERQGKLESAKTRLGAAEFGIQEQRQANESKAKTQGPIEISAGSTLYDPITGKSLFQAPNKPTSEYDLQRLEIQLMNATTAQDKAALQNQISELKIQQLLNQGGLNSKQFEAAQKIQGAEDIANQIQTLIGQLGPSSFGPQARVQGLLGTAAGKIGLQPQVTQYNALRQASIAPLARAISGEVGVLTDRDIARAEALLPTVYDSQEEVTRKIANLRQAINDRRAAIVNPTANLYGTPNTGQPGQFRLPDGTVVSLQADGTYQ